MALGGCGSNSPDLSVYNANQDNPTPASAEITTAWLGDSYVALGAWLAWFPGSENLGHGGDDTGAVLARVPAALPATTYVWCGVNDLNEGRPRDLTLADYGAIIDAAHAAGSARVICLSPMPYARQFPLVFDMSITPAVTGALCAQLRVVALAHGAEWRDIRPAVTDAGGWCAEGYSEPAGIHLSAGGYIRVVAMLRNWSNG